MSSIIAEILVLTRRRAGWAALLSTVVLAVGGDAHAVIGGDPPRAPTGPRSWA